MDIAFDSKAIKDRTFVLAFFTLFFLIAPGIAGIYLYFPAYIVELDSIKLILLSVTCTMPIAVLNAITIGMCERRQKERRDDLFHDFVFGTIVSGTLIYFVVILSHLMHWSVPRLGALLLVVEILTILGIWLNGKRAHKLLLRRTTEDEEAI
ncbi:MAG: hypothetical protein V4480_04360 [Patescibacteria group bacterium]